MRLKEETLQKNLEVLKKIDPKLVKWMNEEPDVDWAEVIWNKHNQPNLLISVGSKKITAYSTDINPLTDLKKRVKKEEVYKENVTVQIGAGLGYLIRAQLDKAEKGHRLILIEPTASILKMALSHYDFTKLILDGSLIIPYPKGNLIALILSTIDASTVVAQWRMSIEGYALSRPKEYQKKIDFALKQINQMRCNTGTITGAGHVIADNDIANLPYVIRHRGIAELKDLFKDKPAVLVSTGPSLEKHIHKLKDIADRIVLIAVAQALRPLLAYDVRPDFICTVDFGEVNMGHLKGLMDSNVPLIALNRTYAPLLKAWKGPKFICATPVPGFENTSCGILQHRGWVDQGGSVAHLNLGLAYHMGCNPIILIGQDLAVGETSHFMQADAAGTTRINEEGQLEWQVTDPRCSLLNKDKTSMGAPVQVPGYFGGFVVTNVGLMSFIKVFESMAEQYKDRALINATEGGANITGFKRSTFDRSVDKYCKEQIDKSVLNPLLSLAPDGDELIEKALPLLRDDINLLNEIRKESLLALRSNRKMIKNLNNSKKLRRLFKDNEIHSTAAHKTALRNNLMIVSIFRASREIQDRSLKVKSKADHLLKNRKDLKIRIERNEYILKAALEMAKSLRKTYQKTLDVLEEYQKTKDESPLVSNEVEPIVFRDVDEYFETGNWAHPLLDARRFLKMYGSNQDVQNYLQKQDLDSSYLKELSKAFQCDCSSNLDEFLEDSINDYYQKLATKIYKKALKMREESIKKAKKWDSEYNYKLVRYNRLIEKARKAGGEKQDFDRALRLLKKAARLRPDRIEAQWGLATTLHHLNRIPESLEEYKKLTENFPNNLSFRFEMAIVMLKADQFTQGMRIIKETMEKTDQFNSFYQRIGDLYLEADMPKEALIAYEEYLHYFPSDYGVWMKRADCLRSQGREKEAEEIYERVYNVKPELKQKVGNLKLIK